MEDQTLNFETNEKYQHTQNTVAQIVAHVKEIDKHEVDLTAIKGRLDKQLVMSITKGEYGLAILYLLELIDWRQQITWHIIQPNQLISKTMVIRDARNGLAPTETPEPYIIMALNNLRAAKALLPKSGYDSIKIYLALMIRNFHVKTKDAIDINQVKNDLALFNTVLINNIASVLKIKFEEAYERLNVAKDFVNLYDEAKHFVTLSTLHDQEEKNVTVFQADLAMTSLTENIKNEYLKRNEKIWYQKLPSWHQELVDIFTPYILTENRVLPTQRRATPIVGNRNSYQTLNVVIRERCADLTTADLTTNVFHSGTLVVFGPDEQENNRIGILNGEQLGETTKALRLLALTFNSDWNIASNDKIIVPATGIIARSQGFYHANLPLNRLRRISANVYTGIYQLLGFAGSVILPRLLGEFNINLQDYDIDSLEEIINDLPEYLSNTKKVSNEGRYVATWEQFLGMLKDDSGIEEKQALLIDLCEIIELSITTCFLTHNNMSPLDADNRNLKLTCYTNILATRLEPYLDVAINLKCESGKDRTGIALFSTAIISFHKAIFGSYSLSDNEVMKNNIIRLACGRHYQLLAGYQGGTYGAFGIKEDSDSAIPENEFPKEVADILIEKTASFNKKIIISADNNLIYFPIGTADVRIQKLTIDYVLNLQLKRIYGELTPEGSRLSVSMSQRLSTIFPSSSNLTSTAHLISNILSSLTAINEHTPFSELVKIIDNGVNAQKRIIGSLLNPTLSISVRSTLPLLESIALMLHEIEEMKLEQVRQKQMV